MKQYHIITCVDEQEMQRFIYDVGAVGLCVNTEKRKLIQMAWDILADLSKVKKGDYILLHSRGLITGIFEVVSDPVTIYDEFQTFNLIHQNSDNLRNMNFEDYCWWIPIKPVEDLQFKQIPMDYVFDMIARGKIKSLPQRLRYEDKNKIVKTITPTDFKRIVKLFLDISYTTKYPIKKFKYIGRTKPIVFDVFLSSYEKNLEAVVCYKLSRGKLRIETENEVDKGIKNSLSSVDYVLNTVPLGYLKMADIVTWNFFENEPININIWELKIGDMAWDNLKDELRKMINRSDHVSDFLNTSSNNVSCVFVCKSYSQDCYDGLHTLVFPIKNISSICLMEYSLSDNDNKLNFKLKAKFGGPT